jgi:hypothetical protein
MNWRGRPLVSHEVVVETIAATTTRTGLTVHAELDEGDYPTGVKVSDRQLKAVPIRAHESTASGTTRSDPNTTHPNPTNYNIVIAQVLSL